MEDKFSYYLSTCISLIFFYHDLFEINTEKAKYNARAHGNEIMILTMVGTVKEAMDVTYSVGTVEEGRWMIQS